MKALPAPLAAILAVLAVLACAAQASAYSRAIVLPLQPGPETVYDGLGPAIQNVFENVLALHPDMEETYLLRHLGRTFPDGAAFQDYLARRRPLFAPVAGAWREGARFVVGGLVHKDQTVEVILTESGKEAIAREFLPIDAETGLVELKRGFADFITRATGLPFPPAQREKASTPDKTNIEGLRAFGKAYAMYMLSSLLGSRALMDWELPRRALALAPESYLALNLHGWMLHVAGKDNEAPAQFKKALAADPDGVDALDGMAQIALRRGGLDQALPWALKRSGARGADTGPALAQLHMILGGQARRDKQNASAAWHYRKAAALDPQAEQPVISLATARHAMGRDREALAALDAKIKNMPPKYAWAILVNFKARLQNWIARELRAKGQTDDERKSLEDALATLKTLNASWQDSGIRETVALRMADLAFERSEPDAAARVLESLKADWKGFNLPMETRLAKAWALTGATEKALGQTRFCTRIVMERMRRHDPVARDVFLALSGAFAALGDEPMAASLARLAGPDPAAKS
jgi:tetratricopeptide (TPR) repeat protein